MKITKVETIVVTMPMIIEAKVTHRVSHTPCRTWSENRYCRTVGQSQAGLVMKLLTSIAASTSRTAADTHRQGCRCGIALIGNGASLGGTVGSVVVVMWRRGDQFVAPLTTAVLMAPAEVPQLSRIFW